MLLLFEQIFINLAWYNGIAKIFFFFLAIWSWEWLAN